jgi:electron transfer flavoprotein alpha subunit
MLAVIPVREGQLPAGGLEVADECAGRTLLIGSGTAEAALLLAGRTARVSAMEAGTFAPAAWAAALAPHLDAEPHLVLPASPDGRDLAPRLAAAMHRELFAGAIAVSPGRIELARHGGLVIDDVSPAGSFVATLQPGVRGVEPHEPSAVPPTIDRLAAAGPGPSVQTVDAVVVETLAPDAATMDLAESPRILGGGAGLSSEAAFAELTDLAVALDASMGATRVVTDRGWVGHERQIGTTGVVVDPRLYIAFGISGAVQHTSGLGRPDHIVSVNTDPHCPMMQLADLAIVSDANAVVTALLERVGRD